MKRRASLDELPLVPTTRLPSKTLLYCAFPRGGLDGTVAPTSVELPDGRLQFWRAPPAESDGYRVCEFSLQRSVTLAHGRAIDDATVRHLGVDGWCSADGTVIVLVEPQSTVRLIDDDKQAGRVQATLRDMWWSQAVSTKEAMRWRSSER